MYLIIICDNSKKLVFKPVLSESAAYLLCDYPVVTYEGGVKWQELRGNTSRDRSVLSDSVFTSGQTICLITFTITRVVAWYYLNQLFYQLSGTDKLFDASFNFIKWR